MVVPKTKMKDKTRKILMIMALVNAVLFMVFSIQAISSEQVTSIWYTILSISFAVIISIEVGVMTYLKKSTYKDLTAREGLDILSLVFAGMVLMNGIIAIPLIGAAVPAFLVTFLGFSGLFVGLAAAIIAVVHLFI